MTPHPDQGLRERKKQATRAALSQAAWTLMLTEGLDAVSPERVAEAVGVTGRTFRNYFGSREEAIVEAVVHKAESVADALRARPPGEPLWDTLAHVLPDAAAAMVGRHEDAAVLLRTTRQNPAMLAQHLASFERVRRLLSEVIAERSDTDGEHDLTSALMAAAAGAALQTSIEVWAGGDGRTSLPEVVRESIAQLRAGIPPASIPKPQALPVHATAR
jgi:AcrR family transcriptional regulator